MKKNLPTIIPLSTEIDRGEVVKKKKKVTLDSPIDEWGTQIFAKYFEYLYQSKFNKPYILNKADLAQMKRLMELKENKVIKEYMEKFIELDYFPAKTLRIFCSSFSQVALDSYFSGGKLPYNKERVVKEDEYDKQLEDAFGGTL